MEATNTSSSMQIDADGDGVDGPHKKVSLLELAETSLSQSLLLFLFANLRFLSATGRITTKYEHLTIDIDQVPRDHARALAGYSRHEFQERRGITGAYIMAIFLLEVSREAEQIRTQEKEGNGSRAQDSMFFDGENDDDAFFDGREDLETVGNMHALLGLFKRIVAQDLKRDIQPLKKEQFPVNSPPPPSLRSQESDFRRSKFLPRAFDLADEEEALFTAPPFSAIRRQTLLKGGASTRRLTALQDIEDLDNNLFNEMSTEMSGIYSKDELREQLVQAIENRDFSRLGFMKEFFKEGSLARSLVESEVEMMWLNDWYNHAECTYGIAVDREKKQVLLSFRGAFTKTDWSHAKDIKFTSTGNPVEDSYPGRPNTIKLHSGFHKYLFRIRKDTSTTKYDEISEKLALYCAQLGEGTTVIVTGHSLGAALTVVFSLYASTDERFTRSGALEAIPFGGPYVGGYTFADAVRYQETQGKLRIARFHNTKDGVCHLPPALFSMSKRGAVYFSNGFDVKLPMIRKGLCRFLPQPQAKIKYMGRESFMRSWTRQVKEFYFFNLPLRVWKSSKMHSLHETKLRLELTKLLEDPETSPMAKYSLEELYDMRDNFKSSAHTPRFC